MKPALLVIDVQKAFFKNPETTQSLNQAIAQINMGIELFREKRLPIICIQHMVKENGLLPGTEGFDLPESLTILPLKQTRITIKNIITLKKCYKK